MIRCLKHFNFGDSLINWVNLFYTKSVSCTINNCHLSNFFPVERGVRQGCPLVALSVYYIIELLSYEVSNNISIKGINFKGHEIKNILFADDATFITDDITFRITSHSFQIYDSDFKDLKNLKYLGLHSAELDFISENSFAGLYELEHLDLSNCQDLCQESVLKSLMNFTNAPKLKALDLNGLCTAHGTSLKLTKEFFSILKQRRIKWLSLSGTNLFVDDPAVVNLPLSLTYLDISNITYFDDLRHRNISRVWKYIFENVREINISLFPIRVLGSKHLNLLRSRYQSIDKIDCDSWPKKLRVINASHIFPYEVMIDRQLVDFSNCTSKNWTTIIARGNKLTIFNVTIIWPLNITIIKIDLSFNSLEFLSPNAFKELVSIKHLFLSNNRLFKMELTQEFSHLTETLVHLEYINLDFNKLTFVPINMFANNTALKDIHLRGNFLKNVQFYLNHLSSLKMLDLKDNDIQLFDLNTIEQISAISTEGPKTNQSPIIVDMHGNPLRCSCENVDILEWIVYKKLNISIQYCFFKNVRVKLDGQALDKTKYLCIDSCKCCFSLYFYRLCLDICYPRDSEK